MHIKVRCRWGKYVEVCIIESLIFYLLWVFVYQEEREG